MDTLFNQQKGQTSFWRIKLKSQAL